MSSPALGAARAARRVVVLAGVASLVATGLVTPSPGDAPPVLRAATVALAGASEVGQVEAVKSPLPTELVGFEWDGRTEGAVEVRSRVGEGWTPWVEVHGNPEEGPDRSSPEYRGSAWERQTTAGPVWVGRGVRDLEVRVAEGPLADLRLHAIHSSGGGTPTWSAPVADASPAAPAIIPRSAWGADESWRTYAPGCDGEPSYASRVRNAIVHHTVNANDYSLEETDDLLRGIYLFHTRTNGWCDIAYNFLVDRFGRVFEGRAGGVTQAVIGAHAQGFNTASTGVALLGDFSSTRVSASARGALTNVLSWKLAAHGVDPRAQVSVTSSGSARYPEGAVAVLNGISGHRDVQLTSCPGDLAYPLLPQLRLDVQRAILGTVPYPMEGWEPATSGPGLYSVNAWGGLHPGGSAPAAVHGAYFPNRSIVRAAVADAVGGYTVDAYGGLHPFGGAPPTVGTGYWYGQDLARGAARGPRAGSGYVLDAYGGLHPYGGAPAAGASPRFPGRDLARGVATAPDGGRSGYVLDAYGGLHEFGGAPSMANTAYDGYWPGWDIARAVALRADGRSGYVVDGWGGVHEFGGAPDLPVSRYTVGRDEARGIVLADDGLGGWTVDTNGALWPFGSAAPVAQTGAGAGLGLTRGLVRVA